MDKEEIIRRLKRLAEHSVHTVGEPPLILSLDDGIALNETVQLLKEQDAVKPVRDKKTGRIWLCGNCGSYVGFEDHDENDPNEFDKFCRKCGHPVLWEVC